MMIFPRRKAHLFKSFGPIALLAFVCDRLMKCLKGIILLSNLRIVNFNCKFVLWQRNKNEQAFHSSHQF